MIDSDEEVFLNKKNKSFLIIDSDDNDDSVNNEVKQPEDGEKINIQVQRTNEDNIPNTKDKTANCNIHKAKGKFKKYEFWDDEDDVSGIEQNCNNFETNVNSIPNNTEIMSVSDIDASPRIKSNDHENSEIFEGSACNSKPKKYKLLSDDDIYSDTESEPNKYDINDGLDWENKNISEFKRNSDIDSKKKMRKKKLTKLNNLKKKEIETEKCNQSRSRSSSASESDADAAKSLKNRKKTKKRKETDFIEKNYKSLSSSRSEDETGVMKSSGKKTSKSDNKSHAKQKSKKVDPMLEIRSESQRRIREGRIALPYHQPKKRTLDEFLARRKNVPSIPLKPSNEILNSVCERLSKQEKEVAVFYKSESEHSENEGDTTCAQFMNKESDLPKPSLIINNENCVSICEKDNLQNISQHSENTNLLDIVSLCSDVSANIEDTGNQDTENIDCRKNLNISTLDNNNQMEAKMCAETNDVTTDTIIISNSVHPDENYLSTNENIVNCEKNCSRENMKTDKNKCDDNKSICSEKNCVENKKINDHIEGVSIDVDVGKLINTRCEKQLEDMEVNVDREDGIDHTCCQQHHQDKGMKTDCVGKTTKHVDSFQMRKDCERQISKCDEPILDSEDFMLQIQDSCEATDFGTNMEIPEQERVVIKPLSEEKKLEIRKRKLALFSKLNVPLLANVKLNAEPGAILQFEVASLSKTGVAQLMEKFTYNTSVKSLHQKKASTKLNIISMENDSQGEFVRAVKKTVEIVTDSENDNEFGEHKFTLPGSKFAYFKDTLKRALISKKQRNTQEYKNERGKFYDTDSSDGETDENCKDSNVIFEKQKTSANKLNFEPYHPEDELDDEELIEDDVVFKDKKKKKNDYVDEEAEVSYDEEENIIDCEEEETDNENSEDDNVAKSVNCDSDQEVSQEEDDAEGEKFEENEKTNQYNVDSSASFNGSSTEFKKPGSSDFSQLFKCNTTGLELENRVLGLENIYTQKVGNTSELTNSQIFELCSDKFPTQIERPAAMSVADSQFFTDSQTVEDSQSINLSVPDTNDQFGHSETNISIGNRNCLFLSDESDTEELFARKRKSMKIEDSDDESQSSVQLRDNHKDEDKSENFAEDGEDEEDADVGDSEDSLSQEVGYNSEEEIINIKEKVTKEFFDHEAELSESEWDSEDEAEHGLDELEKEEGDDDEIDQEKLKEELGKIHMRQLLDDDQKDVRLLQEMLLEDGELHSDGKRERKFKWKNAEDDVEFYLKPVDSDDEQINDEEDEDENWRKERYGREMYISQQEKKSNLLEDVEDDDSDSIPLAKSLLTTLSTTATHNDNSPNFKSSFNNQFKCGSFLSRRKSILNRIAAVVGDSKEKVNSAKNHRNFVFGTVSPEKELPHVPVGKTEKRKISSKFVMAAKKLKLSTNSNVSFTKQGLLAQLASFE